MLPSTRTPEGEPNRCSVCGKDFRLEPSRPPGDAPCPNCGSLMWFGAPNQWSAATDPAKYDALFHHACQKIEKGEVDYGIKILRILCKRTPRRLEYRRALWKAQRRAGRSKVWHRAMNAENRRRLRFAQNENDWVAVQAAADDCLEYEPFDGELHLDLGSAFLEQGLREHAIFAFRCAYDLLPDRSEIWETIEELMKS